MKILRLIQVIIKQALNTNCSTSINFKILINTSDFAGVEDQPEIIEDDHPERPEHPEDTEPDEPPQAPIHHPQLQIRRDLHPSKPSTITSEMMEPHSFLGPYRKRQLDADRPNSAYSTTTTYSGGSSGRSTPPMNLRVHNFYQLAHAPQFMDNPNLLKPPDGQNPPPHLTSPHVMPMFMSQPPKIPDPGPSTSMDNQNVPSDLSMRKEEVHPPRPPQNPPKKTGFTIADIMGR